MVALNVYEREKAGRGVVLNRTHTQRKCGRTSGGARVMDEREKLLCSPGFGEEACKKGEFTETGPINNDPEVDASLYVSKKKKKNMLVFGMEDSYFAFKLIRPQLNDNEKTKTKSSLSFSKENDDVRATFIFAWLSVSLYQ